MDNMPKHEPQEARGLRGRLDAHQAAPEGERRGMWRISYGHPDQPTSDHQPTVMARVVDQPRWHQLYRAACRGCEYEGPERRRANQAVEDAHDHAWPGWRELPAVQPSAAADYNAALRARWLRQVTQAYPPGWLTSGGPLVMQRRQESDERHRPGAAPGGGYELAAERLAARTSNQPDQPTLF